MSNVLGVGHLITQYLMIWVGGSLRDKQQTWTRAEWPNTARQKLWKHTNLQHTMFCQIAWSQCDICTKPGYTNYEVYQQVRLAYLLSVPDLPVQGGRETAIAQTAAACITWSPADHPDNYWHADYAVQCSLKYFTCCYSFLLFKSIISSHIQVFIPILRRNRNRRLEFTCVYF